MAILSDLPSELLDHITSYLPTASAVSNLSRTSRSLKQAVEKDGWATFNRSRFPSLQIPHPRVATTSSYQKDVSRTLVTLSRNWDRRAFVARYVEPSGDIKTFPGNNKLDKWKRPRGQTIGFTPKLDSFEAAGSHWSDRKEVLAFSAGAEICLREKVSTHADGHPTGRRHENVQWVTYRPSDALEGRDDVTSLHLLRPYEAEEHSTELEVIRGTANGTLELLNLPLDLTESEASRIATAPRIQFKTEGFPVRSTSLTQRESQKSLLAAALGEATIALYCFDNSNVFEQTPSSRIHIPAPQNGSRSYRAWSTNFISSTTLAVGLGPSEDPIHVYPIQPSGIDKDIVRKFSLQNDLDRLEGEIKLSGSARKSKSSVYPVVPLPPSSTSDGNGAVFLSGAYDGIVRLHDLRSHRQVEQAYIDPTMNDSAVYSLLPRGQEKLVVGTSRHSLLKVFDMRLGAKCYSYLSTSQLASKERPGTGWNLFLKPHSATYPGRGGGNNWARRSAESSIYSLTSPSPTSPFVFAGVENAIAELTFTDLFHMPPDPAFFDPSLSTKKRRDSDGVRAGETLNLAMYEQSATKMELMSQRSVEEVRTLMRGSKKESWKGQQFIVGLDERWRIGT